MITLRHIAPWMFALLLTACSSNPATTTSATGQQHAQEIRRDQVANLQQIGVATTYVYGDPLGAVEIIQKKADAAGAHYYFVSKVEQTEVMNQWYTEAILYR